MLIKDMKLGSKVQQVLLLRVQKIATSSKGSPYARGLAEDRSGRLQFICFERGSVDRLTKVDGPTPFKVGGTVDGYKYNDEMVNQLLVQHAEALGPNDDIRDLLPQGDFDQAVYSTKLANFIKAVRQPLYRSLLEELFKGEVYDQFLLNPAGSRLHHAYLGGLLQHSVDVAGLALAMAGQYEEVDKDLVITGALLHDIGKIKEISHQVGFSYTDTGRLLGHISLSALMVQEAALKLKMPLGRLEQLFHVLLSHHGENDKGSPIPCSTKEAFIVHYADELDAVMNQFQHPQEEVGREGWQFNKMLQRYLYSK